METTNDEITLKELLLKAKEWYTFLRSKWKTIVLAGIIGALAGLGYSFSVYNQNIVITNVGGNNTYNLIGQDVNYSKDKLSLHFVELPIEIRWRNSTPESHKFWRIYTGLKLSYLFYDSYKFVSTTTNIKSSGNTDLNAFHYGVYAAVGWNTLNLYMYYGFNPLFTSSAKIDNQSIDMSTLNIGLMFYIL